MPTKTKKPSKKKPSQPTYETLYCQEGEHEWTRQRRRGAKPKNCEQHQTEKDAMEREEQQRRMREGRERAQRERNRVKIESVLETKRAVYNCHCFIDPDMTLPELQLLGGGCTDPRWACPVLDSVRRSLED